MNENLETSDIVSNSIIDPETLKPIDYGLSYNTIISDNIEEIALNNDSLCVSLIMTSETPLMSLFRTLYRFSGYNETVYSGCYCYGDLLLSMCYKQIHDEYKSSNEFKLLFDNYYADMLTILQNKSRGVGKSILNLFDSNKFKNKFTNILCFASVIDKCYVQAVDSYNDKNSLESINVEDKMAILHNPRKSLNRLLDYMILHNFSFNFDQQTINIVKCRLDELKMIWQMQNDCVDYKKTNKVININTSEFTKSVASFKTESLKLKNVKDNGELEIIKNSLKEILNEIQSICSPCEILKNTINKINEQSKELNTINSDVKSLIRETNKISMLLSTSCYVLSTFAYIHKIHQFYIMSFYIQTAKSLTKIISEIYLYDVHLKTSNIQTVQQLLTNFDSFDELYCKIGKNIHNANFFENMNSKSVLEFFPTTNEMLSWLTQNISNSFIETRAPILNGDKINRDIQFLVAIDRHPKTKESDIIQTERIKFFCKMLVGFKIRLLKFMNTNYKFNMELLIPNRNATLMVNRNVLINYASTKWFFMSDDDDEPCSVFWLSKAIDYVKVVWDRAEQNEEFKQKNGKWLTSAAVAYLYPYAQMFFKSWWMLLINRVAFILNNYFVEPYFVFGEDARFYKHLFEKEYKMEENEQHLNIEPAVAYFRESSKFITKAEENFHSGMYVYSYPSFSGYDFEPETQIKSDVFDVIYNIILGPEAKNKTNLVNESSSIDISNEKVAFLLKCDEEDVEKMNPEEKINKLLNLVPHVDEVIEYDIFAVTDKNTVEKIQNAKRFFITNRLFRKKKIEEINNTEEWNEYVHKYPALLHGGSRLRIILGYILIFIIIMLIVVLIVHSLVDFNNYAQELLPRLLN